jgi:hypothetical protein
VLLYHIHVQCSHMKNLTVEIKKDTCLFMGNLLVHGAAEQIKRFGGVNTRAVVGVGWCTWSPSVLSVTPFQ